jgi:hypothetical protein
MLSKSTTYIMKLNLKEMDTKYSHYSHTVFTSCKLRATYNKTVYFFLPTNKTCFSIPGTNREEPFIRTRDTNDTSLFAVQYQYISVEFWTTAHSPYPAGKNEIYERSATHLPKKKKQQAKH